MALRILSAWLLAAVLSGSQATPGVQQIPPDPAGMYEGVLEAGPAKLRLVLHVERDAQGNLTAKLDSLDQSAKGLPITDLQVNKDGKISWEFKPGQGRFEGTLTSEGMIGRWKQGAIDAPLSLKRVEKLTELRRPQVPKQPYPYAEEEVTFPGGAEGVRLSGTFTKPLGEGPFPAAVLISGSGPQDRDETLFDHKPFLILADYLTRRGIAVLRYDDRGYGKSTGNFETATSADFARDAKAALQYLKDRSDIRSGEVGLVGHSEGAMVAAMVAAGQPDVDFVVMLAGLGRPAQEVLLQQGEDVARAMGIPNQLIKKLRPFNEEIYKLLQSEKSNEQVQQEITQILTRMGEQLTDNERKQFGPYLSTSLQNMRLLNWMRSFLRYDPVPELKKIKAPVLALSGEKDIQVKAEPNNAGIRAALRAGGNRDVTVEILPRLNHLFQTARTGHVDEYIKIEETFAPSALAKIGDWIVQRTKPSP